MHTDLDDPGDDSNDYLEGLEGFFNEDVSAKTSASGDKAKKGSLSKTQPTKKGTPRPKRRQPARRTTINIDDLLDGIDLPSAKREDPPTSPHISSPHAASSDVFSMPPSPTPPECSMRMESNLQTYISAQFNSLRDDFLCELERMLSENDVIDATVTKFLIQLKDNLREIFQIDNVSSDRTHRVISSVESLMPSFKDLMKSARRLNIDEKEEELEHLGLAQVSLSSFVPILSDSFRTMTDDLNRDIGDLRTTQSKVRKSDLKMKQQRRIAFEGVLELESRKIKQDIDTQTISELSQVISEFRRSLKSEDDMDDIYASEADESDNSKKLRSSINKLRKQIESFNAEPLARIKSWRRRFDEYMDEVGSIREMEHFNHQRFLTSATNAMYLASQPVMPMTPPPSPPRVSFVDDYPVVPASPVREEPRPLIESVRKRLQMLNEERAAVLESSVNFMEDVHRQEKRRIRMSK